MAVYDNMAYETPMSEPDTYFGEKMSMETMSYEKPLPTPPADDICFEDKLNEAEFTFALQNSKAATLVSDSTSPIVAVIGVGYVGFELVQAFGRAYPVIAFDVSRKRILDVQQQLGHRPSIICTSDPSQLDGATHFLIAVPTNLLPNRNVDESALRKALLTLTPYVRPGAVVMIESSVAVGMTRRLLKPLMRSKGAKGGMSPEVSSRPPLPELRFKLLRKEHS
jgi:threonine dehydrogenase-like Zn-dependent dehydrogenase